MDSEIVNLYINEKYSANKLAKLYNTTSYKITKILKNNNTYIRNRKEAIGNTRCKIKTDISYNQHQIIEGCLLSDANVYKSKDSFTPYLRLSSISNEYIIYLFNNLPFQASMGYKKPHTSINNKDNSLVNHKEQWNYRSKSDISLINYRDRWYPNGKKIIPDDFEITPLAMLMCFIGDGYCSKSKEHGRLSLALCLEGFDKIYTEKLQEKMALINLNFRLTNRSNNYRLTCNKQSDIVNFFNFIGTCPKDLGYFSYKWKTRELIYLQKE